MCAPGLSTRERPRLEIERVLFACRHNGFDALMSPSVEAKYSLCPIRQELEPEEKPEPRFMKT
jgi:hypothetical protein